ncbi:MAG: AraC family transcriptional regulator [Caulobacterales bacterium]|nr:AraC family transcriptional regulator [Caulobacterales bacterium]
MPNRYQDVYPSPPLLRSVDELPPRAADLVHLEYFEAEEGSMPKEVFVQHHILVNLLDAPQRVENWRGDDHRDYMISRHDVVVTPAGLASGWRWYGRSRCIVITLDPEPLARFAGRELGLILTDAQLVDEPQRHDPDLSAAATQLYDALATKAQGSDVLYEALARVFVVKLLRAYAEQRASMEDRAADFGSDRYKRVLDFISSNMAKPIGVEDMAASAGMSASAFSRAFKAAVGDTPHQFLSRYRVERAQDMMRAFDRPLLDIALACGFADQPHLGRVFKKFTGETPKAWRTRVRDGAG